jgi:hypothetical protein
MLRTILGVAGGFFAWLTVWVVSEKITSALWPAFGVHQEAFQAAITDGGDFTAEGAMLVTHIVLGSIVSVISGFLAALIAGGNSRAPLIMGFLLLAMGLLKAVMSWSYVPIWYHILFTALLLPMALLGGKLYPTP